MKILIIEDEKELAQSVCSYLSGEHFMCEVAHTYATGLDKALMHDYGCIVLDLGLPGGSGLDIVKELKRNQKADGLIVISARNAIDDKVSALKEGADDYLTKPFHLSELGARVAAIIRRKSFEGNNTLQFDELRIDLGERSLMIHQKTVELTRKEFDLLLYFIGNKNKVITKTAIAEHLWGDHMGISSNYDFLYTHIKNLRKKLLQHGSPDYIQSVYGMGYKFGLPRS